MAGARKALRERARRPKSPVIEAVNSDHEEFSEARAPSPAVPSPTASHTTSHAASHTDNHTVSQEVKHVQTEDIIPTESWQYIQRTWPELGISEFATWKNKNQAEFITLYNIQKLLYCTAAMAVTAERYEEALIKAITSNEALQAQLTTQQYSRPPSHSVNYSATQSTTQSTTQPDIEPDTQPNTQPAAQPTSQPATQPATQPAIQLNTQKGKQRLGITQCYRCFGFGHIASICTKNQVCGFCSQEGHTTPSCPGGTGRKPACCVNCNGNHQA